MSNSKNTHTQEDRELTIDDVARVLDTLSLGLQREEPAAQREFSRFIQYWSRLQVKTTKHHELIHKTRGDIHDLVMSAEPEEKSELRGIITREVQSMRADIRQLLAQDIMDIYSAMDSIERKSIDALLQNTKISQTIPLGMMLLLKHIEVNNDKKSEWIKGAFRHVYAMADSIQLIRSRTRGSAVHKDMIFGQFMDMYQETLASVAAIACHIYSEDCSVILQPIKVKCSGASPSEMAQNIDDIMEFISSKQNVLPGGYFPGLQQFLLNPENRQTLISGKYVYIPLIVDAKDLLLYLHTMDDFFASWKQSMITPGIDKFRVLNNTIVDAHERGVQPRMKFHYQKGRGAEEFNIRLDYVRSAVEMDVGGVDFHLQNGGNLIDFLTRQDRPIIANSYALGGSANTSRIIADKGLSLEEKIALIHSAMMEQGSTILGRDESRIYGYHFILKEDVSETEWNEIQKMFQSLRAVRSPRK